MKTIFLIIIFCFNISVMCADCKGSNNQTQFSFLKELEPFCFKESGNDWKNPEETAAKIMKDLTQEEIAVRLIFSEALASGCKIDELNEVMKGIAWVLYNRQESKSKTYGLGLRNIIFKKSQFASSFAGYDVAKRKELLCPSESPNFKILWGMASGAFIDTCMLQHENPLPTVRNYFFPNHFKDTKSEKIKKWIGVYPEWANEKTLFKPTQISPNPSCILFYNL